MSHDRAKISPAFDPLLASGGPDMRFDAIVLLRAEDELGPAVSRRRHRTSHRARLGRVREIARAQAAVQEEIVADYRRALGASDEELRAHGLGSGALPLARVEVTPSTIGSLAENPNVLAILPNQRIELIQPLKQTLDPPSPAEVKRGRTWGLDTLEARLLWERARGEGITVAVLDTGVHDAHPVFGGRVRAVLAFDPLGRRIKVDPAFDGDEHGTHVCGTVAGGETAEGVAIGVAPAAALIVGAVLIGRATLVSLLEAIGWAVEAGADVINLSLGFTMFEPHFTLVLDRLVDQFGIVPVVSVGNESHGNTSSPGNAPSAFSVGAVMQGADGSHHVSRFSSGASLHFPGDPRYALVHKPDVVAPGERVYSAIPPRKVAGYQYEYAYMSGTSMAAPHVSGAVALLMAAKPDAGARDIVLALKESAWHPAGTTLRPDNRWGYGLIRPAEALKLL
ncbi:MAG TPA: S8 family serine peptidase [Geminicoccaceae bacterium]|nr:S8 family serine peptidase [Geminicoccaceae bacterium]